MVLRVVRQFAQANVLQTILTVRRVKEQIYVYNEVSSSKTQNEKTN